MSSESRQPEGFQPLQEFSDNVTAHGVGKVFYLSKERSCRRWLWLVLLLGALVALVVIVTDRVQYFLQNPTATVVKWESRAPVPFPAVTVCNENGFQQSRVAQYGLSTLNNSVLELMTQPVNSFILRCEFAGLECFADNFSVLLDAQFGACYTFHGLRALTIDGEEFNASGPNPLTSARTGPDYGLRLVLDIEQAEYVGYSPRTSEDPGPGSASDARAPPDNRNSTVEALFKGPESAGIRVIIHDPSVLANPTSGFGVGPGSASDIAFERVDRSRLFPPWGTCNEAWHSESGATDPAGYAKTACERDCYYASVADVCECLLLPWPTTMEERPSLYVCSSEEKACIATQLSRFQAGELGCSASCPDRCLETLYTATAGRQLWPSVASASTILDVVRSAKQDTSITPEYLAQNMMSVRVFPPTTEYQVVTTVRAYSFESMLGEVGGNTGLWAGMSALTIVEILEFVMLALSAWLCSRGGCCRRGGKRAPRTNVEHGTELHEGEAIELVAPQADEESSAPAVAPQAAAAASGRAREAWRE